LHFESPDIQLHPNRSRINWQQYLGDSPHGRKHLTTTRAAVPHYPDILRNPGILICGERPSRARRRAANEI
jgi:hypothetical protein